MWVPDMLTGSTEWPADYFERDSLEAPSAWIQWKGTDVCMDIHCSCGELSHVDGEGVYFYECPTCHQKYAVGQNIRLYPV